MHTHYPPKIPLRDQTEFFVVVVVIENGGQKSIWPFEVNEEDFWTTRICIIHDTI